MKKEHEEVMEKSRVDGIFHTAKDIETAEQETQCDADFNVDVEAEETSITEVASPTEVAPTISIPQEVSSPKDVVPRIEVTPPKQEAAMMRPSSAKKSEVSIQTEDPNSGAKNKTERAVPRVSESINTDSIDSEHPPFRNVPSVKMISPLEFDKIMKEFIERKEEIEGTFKYLKSRSDVKQGFLFNTYHPDDLSKSSSMINLRENEKESLRDSIDSKMNRVISLKKLHEIHSKKGSMSVQLQTAEKDGKTINMPSEIRQGDVFSSAKEAAILEKKESSSSLEKVLKKGETPDEFVIQKINDTDRRYMTETSGSLKNKKEELFYKDDYWYKKVESLIQDKRNYIKISSQNHKELRDALKENVTLKTMLKEHEKRIQCLEYEKDVIRNRISDHQPMQSTEQERRARNNSFVYNYLLPNLQQHQHFHFQSDLHSNSMISPGLSQDSNPPPTRQVFSSATTPISGNSQIYHQQPEFTSMEAPDPHNTHGSPHSYDQSSYGYTEGESRMAPPVIMEGHFGNSFTQSVNNMSSHSRHPMDYSNPALGRTKSLLKSNAKPPKKSPSKSGIVSPKKKTNDLITAFNKAPYKRFNTQASLTNARGLFERKFTGKDEGMPPPRSKTPGSESESPSKKKSKNKKIMEELSRQVAIDNDSANSPDSVINTVKITSAVQKRSNRDSMQCN